MRLLPSLPTTSYSFSFHYTLYVVVDPTGAADVLGDSPFFESLGDTISIATAHTHNIRVYSLCESASFLFLLTFTLLRVVNSYHKELTFATISDLTAQVQPHPSTTIIYSFTQRLSHCRTYMKRTATRLSHLFLKPETYDR